MVARKGNGVVERDKWPRERERFLLKGTNHRAKGKPLHLKEKFPQNKNRKLSDFAENFRFQLFQRWTCFKSSLIFVVEMPSVRGR